jgi:hypothetical protein
MMFTFTKRFALVMMCLAVGNGNAQSSQELPASEVVSKSVKAIGYQVGAGVTKVDLKGTELAPGTTGIAKVEAKTGVSMANYQLG